MNSDHSSKDPIQDDKEIGQNRPAIGQGGIISDTLESAAPAERIAAIIPTPIIEKSSDENQGNIPCGPCRGNRSRTHLLHQRRQSHEQRPQQQEPEQ